MAIARWLGGITDHSSSNCRRISVNASGSVVAGMLTTARLPGIVSSVKRQGGRGKDTTAAHRPPPSEAGSAGAGSSGTSCSGSTSAAAGLSGHSGPHRSWSSK